MAERIFMMANFSPISGDSKQAAAALQLSARLQCCWKVDFDWTLVPIELKQVSFINDNHKNV